MAWVGYGWDFGVSPPGWDRAPWKRLVNGTRLIDRTLQELSRIGIFAVRWFLLGDGLTYGVNGDAPQRVGSTWRMSTVPALSPEFLTHFEELLVCFKTHRMKIMPVIVDHQMFWNGSYFDGGRSVFYNQYVKCGRADLLNDSTKRRRFLENVVQRLVTKFSSYHDVIYAWDLINEPEMCTYYIDRVRDRENRTIYIDNMREFIREGVRMINAAGFTSTVGFQYYDTLQSRDWNPGELGIRLRQFHYYGTPMFIPQFDTQLRPIVGEIATGPDVPWMDLMTVSSHSRAPNVDIEGRNTLSNRLHLLNTLGYQVVFLWAVSQAPPRSGQFPTVVWNDATRNEVANFIREQNRNSQQPVH